MSDFSKLSWNEIMAKLSDPKILDKFLDHGSMTKFSDYENMFLKKNKDISISELIGPESRLSSFINYSLDDSNIPFIDKRLLMQELGDKIQRTIELNFLKRFFQWFFKQEGALKIPILGGFCYPDDYVVAVEEIPDHKHKVIYYNSSRREFAMDELDSDLLEPSPLKTVGDFYDRVKEYLYNIL